MQKIESININPNWLYRYITPDMFYKFIKSDGILSERKLKEKQSIKKDNTLGWNGLDYISLSKRTNSLSNTSYHFFNFGNYSLIINSSQVKKAHHTKLPILLAKLPISIRFSIWEDEYQVKDYISLENIIGIKIPEKSITDLKDHLKQISYFISIMEETDFYLPFIDIEEKKKIPHQKAKEYLKRKF